MKFNFLDNISSTKTAYVIILVFALTVYSKSFSSGFVNFDDCDIIRDIGTACTSSAPFGTSTQKVIYRTVSTCTFIMDYSISGKGPKSYHVTNLILHALTCMGLFALMKMLGFDRVISFLMTLLFTVHPLFNQTVAWIPPRSDLLMGLFGIASIITLMKFFEGNKWPYLAAHLMTFSMSVFSKESAIVFPIIYALFYYFRYYDKNGMKSINAKNLSLIAGWILIVGLFLYIQGTFIQVALSSEAVGISVFSCNIWTIPEFAAKFFIPIKLSGMPQFSVLVSSIGILIMAGMAAILAKANRKDLNYLSIIGIVWFLAFTAISMMIPRDKNSFDYLEHRTYLPSMGLIIFILSFIKYDWKRRLICGLIPLIFAYSAYSYVNTDKFKDPIAFYNSIIYGGTNVAAAYNNRGIGRQENGDRQGAIEDYLKAISIKGDYALAYYNKGGIEYEMKEYEIAIDDYTKAIKAKPDFADAHLKRGAVYYDCGVLKQNNGDKQGAVEDYLLAIDDYTKGVKNKPEDAGAYSNRGDIYFKMNRREEAIADYNRGIRLNPQYAGSYNNLGILYGAEGNYPESIRYFTKAIECDNKLGNAYMNRGLAYLYLGNEQKACEDFKSSMECGSDSGKQLYEKLRR